MILFLSVAMLLAGCDKDNAPVAVSEVTLSRTALTMTVGDTEKLTATVLPEHAGYDGLVWSSNNTSVALVDVEGLVTVSLPEMPLLPQLWVAYGQPAK